MDILQQLEELRKEATTQTATPKTYKSFSSNIDLFDGENCIGSISLWTNKVQPDSDMSNLLKMIQDGKLTFALRGATNSNGATKY